MNFTGTFKNLSKNWQTGRWEITFEANEDIMWSIESIAEKMLSVTAKIYRKKRSLDANAYYWQLLSRLAEASNISKPRAHNLMLRRYGQLEEVDGQSVYVIVPDTTDGEEKALEAEAYHIKPTSEVKFGADGTPFRTYRMMRGSSTYDTREMSALINGLVSECKEVGIETLTPDQLDEMMYLYEQNRRKGKDDLVERAC